MKLVGKVPVEPLEEERLTNIERNLVVRVSEMSHRPVRAPGRMLAFAGVALAVIVAGFVGYKLRGGAPVVAPAAPETLALTHQALDLGDAQIASSANAEAMIERTHGRVVVTMKIGRLDLHVAHRPGRVYVVKAGDVEIEDVGTRFSVDFDGHNVDVRVTEGEVKVRRQGKDVELRASEAWTLALGKTTIVALEQRAGQVATAGEDRGAADRGAPDRASDVARAPVAPDRVAPDRVPDRVAPDRPQGSGSGSAATHGKTDTPKALEKRPIKMIEIAEVTDKTVVGYVAYASQQKGEQNAAALYDAAVLQFRAKHDSEALGLLKGVLRADRSESAIGEAYPLALWLQVRIRCKTFDDACRQAAELYLRKFPNGPEAGIAQDVLKQLIH